MIHCILPAHVRRFVKCGEIDWNKSWLKIRLEIIYLLISQIGNHGIPADV